MLLRLTFLQNSTLSKNLSSWLTCLLRVSVSIHNHKALAWPKLLSKNKIRNTLVNRREKVKIINVLEQDLNRRLTEAVCPSLITSYFLPRLMFEKNSFSCLALRIITVLMSDDLHSTHRRWLLLWIWALELIVRGAKEESMKKIVHDFYLYRVFSLYFHFTERQNDGNFVNVR